MLRTDPGTGTSRIDLVTDPGQNGRRNVNHVVLGQRDVLQRLAFKDERVEVNLVDFRVLRIAGITFTLPVAARVVTPPTEPITSRTVV